MVGARLSVELDSQDSRWESYDTTSLFPTEQSVVRVILVGLISNKTIRQSKQIVSRKPHILKNTD